MPKKTAVPQEEDPRIAEYLKSKKPELLNEIMEDYLPFIKIAISRINPSFPVLDKEDLVQCAAIGFIQALNRYNPERGVPFKAWALQRVRGAALDAIRKVSSTARTRNVQMVQLSDIYSYDDDGDIYDIGVSDNASPALKQAIMDLPAQQGAILLLFINGLPGSQIANAVGKSERLVYMEQQAAIEALRDVLAGKLQEFV